MRRFYGWCVALLALAACAPPAARDAATDGSELAALGDSWAESFNAGDLDALAALYAEDGRLMPPGAAMAQGRDAVRAAFGEMREAGLDAELETLEAGTAGDLGFRSGTYRVLAAGEEVDRGKFVEVWRRGDAGWQIATDIWNSDLPAVGAEGLATLVGIHPVADAERWLAAWRGAESRHELFAAHGAPQVTVLQSRDDPRRTGLVIGLSDPAAFEAFLASPEGAAAAAEDGVDLDTVELFEVVF